MDKAIKHFKFGHGMVKIETSHTLILILVMNEWKSHDLSFTLSDVCFDHNKWSKNCHIFIESVFGQSSIFWNR